MTLAIGGTTIDPGDSRWVDLAVCRDLDGTRITIRAHALNGTMDGPTLWCQGAVHGNEPVGGLAVREFVDGLDPASVSGAVVGVPVANPPAFRNRERGAPVHIGAADVNSTFPGAADGSLPQQLAHTLFEAASVADCVVDLHSADGQLVMETSFAYVPAVGGETGSRAREAAVAADVAHVVELPPEEVDGFITTELAREGTPALMIESGSGARVYEWALDAYRRGMRGVAAELGVIETAQITSDASVNPSEHGEDEPTFHDDLAFEFARTGGYVDVSVAGGDNVREGDELAEITDVTGETVETFAAPFDGIVMAVRTFPTARPGDLVVELAPERGAGGYSNRP